MNGWASLGYFLTLVVTPVAGLAAPTSPTPQPAPPAAVAPAPPSSMPAPPADLPWSYPENADLQNAGELRAPPRPARHLPGPWTLATGLRHGSDAERGVLKSSTTLALAYETASRFEYAGEFDTRGLLRLSAVRVWSFWRDSSREPFVSAGLQQSLTSEAFVVSLIDFQKLKARAALGCGEIFDAHPGWRTELSVAVGANGPAYAWLLGRSF